MNLDKPWNDVADQMRPAEPDPDTAEYGVAENYDGSVDDEPSADPSSVLEADPADVADQHRIVPLPDDQS
ncbi:MAG: hypothetical protein JOZ47_04640 [Kutzneria sp.]|nr:hypothetical protein [Kutzneria sp.]MBV9844342.1 hypothetical protein [Kutzneria sp.]